MTLDFDYDSKSWLDKYVADVNFKITVTNPSNTSTVFIYDPFLSNVELNAIKVTDISFTNTANQVGEFSIIIDDSKDRIVDRDTLDNGIIVKIDGARRGYESTTMTPFFYGYCDEIVEERDYGTRKYIINGLSSLGHAQNMLINFVESARRNSLTDTSFATDRRFQAHNLVRQLFEDYEVLPVTGGGKLNLQERGGYNLDGISSNVDFIIPVVDFPNVYASQFLSSIADMVGADIYIDETNTVQFHFPKYDEDITYLKDTYDINAQPDKQDLAWNTSYILKNYVRHGSTRSADGFANYLVGIATTEGDIEISQTEQQAYTSLVSKDIAQQFIPTSSPLFYIAFVASKQGGGSHVTKSETDRLRVRIVNDNNGLPTGSVVTQFFIKLRDISTEPTVIAPPPNNQQITVTPGSKYWITWFRKGVTDDDTIRIWHDNSLNTLPATRSATRLVSIDTDTGVENPRNTDQKGGKWFYSTTGPTYAFSIATPERKLRLEMSDDLSIERWGQVDKKVEATSWIHTAKQLGEYMAALLRYTAKKRWIYNFPEISIPLRPIRAGRAISLRDEILGITGIDEVDAYSIIQEVRYEVKSDSYGLGTNTCSLTCLGFQNPLDFTIGF